MNTNIASLTTYVESLRAIIITITDDLNSTIAEVAAWNAAKSAAETSRSA